ncbi:exopolysaccharide phosphotransferase [Catellatospora sp. TT07R-123]|uniref:stealth family protein n=1 Tax=Catellatospora sp. TT07R-123 TaxID=2733863 RepID=UPI001B19BB2A|nr:stealth family protein [Catellatospora sp. TT07R-123]GHJ48435.1 exopolysaccharide phosphotransferase [Catellatospora sp. TT07R-123]
MIFRVPDRAALRAALSRRAVDRLSRRPAAAGSRRERWTRAAVAWHLRAVFPPEAGTLTQTAYGPVLAATAADATPLRARREALELVLDVLAEAGVTRFCVRGLDDRAAAVAVPLSQRRAAYAALRALARHRPLWVGAVTEEGELLPPRPAGTHHAWQALSGHRVIRVTRFLRDPSGALLYGPEHGCDVELWHARAGRLRAPRPNRAADDIAEDGPEIELPEESFTRLADAGAAVVRPTRPEFAGRLLDDLPFPVDAVYTWVDGADPAWRARRDAALAQRGVPPQAAVDARFADRDELRYSLRSLHLYAPWLRHVWLVTDDQVPPWLDPCHPRITVVSHKQLFGGAGVLPTFNSHAIESRLHHVDGLAEHFLYFNDDVFLGRPVPPSRFFQPNGLTKLFPSKGKVDPGEPVAADKGATSAGKNNRELIGRDFGLLLTYKMKHTPHALRRSVLAEMEQRWPDGFARTAAHQFRDPADLSPASSAYHYYALATGRAVLDRIASVYLSLAAPGDAQRLDRLRAARDLDVFCLNDEEPDPGARAVQERLLRDFLAGYFPVAAPWELDAPGRG